MVIKAGNTEVLEVPLLSMSNPETILNIKVMKDENTDYMDAIRDIYKATKENLQ